MHKIPKKKKEVSEKEKPTKLLKNQEDFQKSSTVLSTDFNESIDISKLKQNIKELQAKNTALNTALAESQYALSNLQVEIARLEKKNQDLLKERGKLEEMSFLNNKFSNDLMKEKQKSKEIHDQLEENNKKFAIILEENELKARKIVSIIRKTKEMSSIVGGLKGKFFEKVDILSAYRETLEKIEKFLVSEEISEENSEENSLKTHFEDIFKDLEEENACLRGSLAEMQEKFKDYRQTMEKFQQNFERVRENSENSKFELLEIKEENEALRKQITALERKSKNQNEIIEILKLRIKAFEEDLEKEEEMQEEERFYKANSQSLYENPRILYENARSSPENNFLDKEIEDLDNEIMYIQKLLK